eukprot:scaffold35455_cov18-Tisochrysis_lutea.AAC.1
MFNACQPRAQRGLWSGWAFLIHPSQSVLDSRGVGCCSALLLPLLLLSSRLPCPACNASTLNLVPEANPQNDSELPETCACGRPCKFLVCSRVFCTVPFGPAQEDINISGCRAG